jgi:hypothetical protein
LHGPREVLQEAWWKSPADHDGLGIEEVFEHRNLRSEVIGRFPNPCLDDGMLFTVEALQRDVIDVLDPRGSQPLGQSLNGGIGLKATMLTA